MAERPARTFSLLMALAEVALADLDKRMALPIGVWIGLAIARNAPSLGNTIRNDMEVEIAAVMGVPPEAIESQMMALFAESLGKPRG